MGNGYGAGGGYSGYGGGQQSGYGGGQAYAGPGSRDSSDDSKGLSKSVKDPVLGAVKWAKSRSPKEKMYMGVAAGVVVRGLGSRARMHAHEQLAPGMRKDESDLSPPRFLLQLLFVLWRTIQDHDTLFVLAEISHFMGVGILGYKVTTKKSVAGARAATDAAAAAAVRSSAWLRSGRGCSGDQGPPCRLAGAQRRRRRMLRMALHASRPCPPPSPAPLPAHMHAASWLPRRHLPAEPDPDCHLPWHQAVLQVRRAGCGVRVWGSLVCACIVQPPP